MPTKRVARFDDRIMEFVLMKLEFPDENQPVFSELATFKTIGVVMNVFLLDPSSRLLSAFVWVASSNTIGLYALLDWSQQEYVFIDTGIECVRSIFVAWFVPTIIGPIVSVVKLVLHLVQGSDRHPFRGVRHRTPILLPDPGSATIFPPSGSRRVVHPQHNRPCRPDHHDVRILHLPSPVASRVANIDRCSGRRRYGRRHRRWPRGS